MEEVSVLGYVAIERTMVYISLECWLSFCAAGAHPDHADNSNSHRIRARDEHADDIRTG